MTKYKIRINDRNYSSWDIYDSENLKKIEHSDWLDFNPIDKKLFTDDVFIIDKRNNINILHSSIRSGPAIPGVLILDGNKTYGRIN